MANLILDAMGSDDGVGPCVLAAAGYSLRHAGGITLVGDERLINPILRRSRYDGSFLKVHHTPEYIRPDEEPKAAFKAKPNASVSVAAQLVSAGEGDGMVSAGPHGGMHPRMCTTLQINPGGSTLHSPPYFRRNDVVAPTMIPSH